jgi:hypothetical protein
MYALDRLFTKEEIDVFQILHGSHPPVLALFFLEYRVRMAKWLTAAGLENHEEDRNSSNQRQWGNIGANESREDEVRNYITVGWGVFWRLADIARKVVYEMTETNVSESKKAISPLTRGLRFVQKLESTIQQQQLEYISSFPGPGRCELTSYYFMHLTISSAFADRVFDDPRGKASKW